MCALPHWIRLACKTFREFLSGYYFKKLERVVLMRLSGALRSINTSREFQSGFPGFRKLDSTETALFPVTNDLYCLQTLGHSVPVLLDTTFDIIKCNIIIKRLRKWGGKWAVITGAALKWFILLPGKQDFSHFHPGF